MVVPTYLVTFKYEVQVRHFSTYLVPRSQYLSKGYIVPLYWSQQGYGLKPPPQLAKDRTPEQNLDAMKRHFGRLINMYGPLTVVNLAEQHGKEAPLTIAYRDTVNALGMKDVQYAFFFQGLARKV